MLVVVALPASDADEALSAALDTAAPLALDALDALDAPEPHPIIPTTSNADMTAIAISLTMPFIMSSFQRADDGADTVTILYN